MNKMTCCCAAITMLILSAGPSWAEEISKEMAVEMALELHPGEVKKSYKETKKGVEVWEVEIMGADGNGWKTYYRVDNGELFMKKKNGSEVSVETTT